MKNLVGVMRRFEGHHHHPSTTRRSPFRSEKPGALSFFVPPGVRFPLSKNCMQRFAILRERWLNIERNLPDGLKGYPCTPSICYY